MKDPRSNILVKAGFSPATKTTNTTGTTVDRVGSDNYFQDAMVVVQTGTITDGTHTVAIQDSDDGTTWAAVAAGFLAGSNPVITATDDDKTYVVGYTGRKRYLRVTVTVAGVTSGGVYGAHVVLSNPRNAPVTQDN